MQRYQVRQHSKEWNDKGPDLLHTRRSAIERTVDLLGDAGPWHWRKRGTGGAWMPWRKLGDRQAVGVWLEEALPGFNDGQMGQLARPSGANLMVQTVAIRAAQVAVPDLANATGRAEITHGLVRHAFGDIRFAGCSVCKRYGGSTDPRVGFSDHAWGDAVDESENKPAGVHNDDVTDWCLRMAIERLLPVEQVIGSRNGHEVEASAPDFHVGPYDDTPTAGTHLWHVHLSCRRHEGIPPCWRNR